MAHNSNSSKSFDPKFMLEQLGNNQSMFEELLNTFIESYPGYLAKLKAAADSKSAKGIYEISHYLLGEFQSLGHAPSVEAALKLQESGKQGNLDSVSAMIQALDQSAQSVIKFKFSK